MNNTLTFITSGITEYLMVASVIATALITTAWGIIKLGKIRDPVYHHMIWLFTLIAILISPVTWLYGPKMPIAILPAQSQSEIALTQHIDFNPADTLRGNKQLEINSPVIKSMNSYIEDHKNTLCSIPMKNVFSFLWFVGFIFMLTRLFVGWVRLERIVSVAEPVSLNIILKKIHTDRLKLLLTSHINSPVCFGLLRPVILLPREMYYNNKPEDLEMVLNHELAHIKRKDCLVTIFQRFIEAVLFFHPFIWYASFQLTQQREQICDNHVVAKGASPNNYVQLLNRIIEQGFEKNRVNAVALFEGRLLSRIRFLLDPGNKIQIRTPCRAVIACAMVILVCLASGAISLETKSSLSNGLESNKTENQTEIASDDGSYLPDGLDSRQVNVIVFDFNSKEKGRSWPPTIVRNEDGEVYSGIYFKTTWRDLIDSGYVQKPSSQN